MARRRTASAGSSTTKRTTSAASEFKCPECERAFTRAAALGAHRRHAHGVAGATSKVKGRPGRVTSARPRRGRKPSGQRAPGAVNRDALLEALFPNGLPAREAVIRAANDWLDQAEQLARMA